MEFGTKMSLSHAVISAFIFFVASIYYAREVHQKRKLSKPSKASQSTASDDIANPSHHKPQTRIAIDEQAGQSQTTTMDTAVPAPAKGQQSKLSKSHRACQSTVSDDSDDDDPNHSRHKAETRVAGDYQTVTMNDAKYDADESFPDNSDDDGDSCCPCCSSCFSFLKEWASLVNTKRKVYFGLIPHLFDQATDFGVIYDYYALWRAQETGEGGANAGTTSYRSFFFASLSVMILHRVISTVAIFRLTRKGWDAVLQMFDLMLVKAIGVNYTLGVDEKADPQRFLEILVEFLCSSPNIYFF